MKKTQWYPVEVNPARPGWYEARYEDDDMSWRMRWFDGEVWRFGPNKSRCSFGHTAFKDKWRGLTKEQK